MLYICKCGPLFNTMVWHEQCQTNITYETAVFLHLPITALVMGRKTVTLSQALTVAETGRECYRVVSSLCQSMPIIDLISHCPRMTEVERPFSARNRGKSSPTSIITLLSPHSTTRTRNQDLSHKMALTSWHLGLFLHKMTANNLLQSGINLKGVWKHWSDWHMWPINRP